MKKRILALLLTVLMVTAMLPFGVSASGEKLIALTFDDGPSQYTSQLLDGLAARDARATFFMLGQNAEGRKSIVKRAWEEGHQICSHTYNHPNLKTLSSDAVRNQFTRTDAILDSALGFDGRYMIRPPYGNYNQNILNIGGVPFFYWSVDTRDWESRNANSAYNEFIRSARDGSIVLMHDIYPTTIEAALRAIDTLKSQGYQFVTVAELFYRRGVTLQNATIYFNCSSSNGTASALSTPKIQQSASATGGLSVTIQGDSRGTVYYTTNGAVPNPANSQKYTGPFTVNSSCTVKAVTVVNWNSVRSKLATAKIDYIPAAAPVLTMSEDVMTMTCATPGAQIRYTTNGAAPTANSTLYTAPITVSRGTTVKAIATAPGYNASAVSMLTYTENGNVMKDVAVTDWFYSYMDRAVTMGIIRGTGEDVMSPYLALNRAMLVTMLHRMAKPTEISQPSTFSDVSLGQYYYEPVCWASAHGIVVGYPDNTFRPAQNITRQELSVMIARYLRDMGYEVTGEESALNSFNDQSQIASWARADMAAMVSMGIIKGYSDGTIGAMRGATRAEAVTMLLRAADLPAPEVPDDPEPVVSKSLEDALNAVNNYLPESAGSQMREYAAAAEILNFVRSDDVKADDLADQIKAWYEKLSAEDRETYRARLDEVIELAEQIAKGEVTHEEVQMMIADTGVEMDPIDPEAFPLDQLSSFLKILTEQIQ